MAEEPRKSGDLWTIAETMSGRDDAERFFADFVRIWAGKEIGEAHARAVFNTGLQSLVTATQKDAGAAGDIIVNHILPICLEAKSPIDSRFVGHDHLREFLGNWIERYPDEQKLPLRSRILSRILAALKTQTSRPPLWAMAAIGYRSRKVEETLIRLSRRPDDIGDTAIACIAALGPGEALEEQLVHKVLRRLRNRPLNAVAGAIQGLAGPQFVPALSRRLLESAGDAWAEVNLLGRIADRTPRDELLQKRVWRVIEHAADTNKEALQAVLIAGNGVQTCDTPEVIPWLVRRLGQSGSNFFLLYNRLKECIRPEQLKGWHLLDSEELKRTLDSHATLSVGDTRSPTIEGHMRKLAWETALSAGVTSVTDWIARTLTPDASQYALYDVLSFASCLRLDTWPDLVGEIVRERVDIQTGKTDPFIARVAAVQVLRASDTKEAFETILDCGLTINGAQLRSTAEAVASLAEHVAREDPSFVVSRLLTICESREIGERRMLAVAALQRLALRQQISVAVLARILAITQDDSLPSYATAAMIWASSWFSEAASIPEFIAFLLKKIDGSNVDAEVKFQSVQALVHLNKWKDHEREILAALDLRESHDRLMPVSASRYQSGQAYILTLLAMRDGRFLEAAAEVVSKADGAVVHMLLQGLVRAGDAGTTDVTRVAEAAIKRTQAVLGRSFGETDNFSLISELAPDEFAEADWPKHWGDWMPAVRASLADALESTFSRIAASLQPRVFDLLEALLGDSTYQVRRTAARSYARLDGGRLERLCDRWIHTGQTELRARSAEMAQWLSPIDPVRLDNALVRSLSHDPEPSVRSAAIRSYQEMRRRFWCMAALNEVTSGDRKDGNDWLSGSYCYGRALAELGDDETIKAIRELRSRRDTPPNIQNWLEAIVKDLENHWQKVVREWPEPWLPWSGQLEEIEGSVMLGEKSFLTKMSLWYRRQEDPADVASWGGGFIAPSPFDVWKQFNREQGAEPIPIAIQGRRSSRVWLSATGMDGEVLFVGNGPYPDRA